MTIEQLFRDLVQTLGNSRCAFEQPTKLSVAMCDWYIHLPNDRQPSHADLGELCRLIHDVADANE